MSDIDGDNGSVVTAGGCVDISGGLQCRGCSMVVEAGVSMEEHLQRSFSCIKYDTRCQWCNKYFCGDKGLKIHLSKSKCKDGGVDPRSDNCIPDKGSNSEVLACQEQSHRAMLHRNLISDQAVLEKINHKRPIRWPRMSDERSWLDLDKLVAGQLPRYTYVKEGVNMLETVLYEEAKTMFGVVEFKKRKNQLSRRQLKMGETKKQLNQLKKAYKKAATEEEKAGIMCLQGDLRVKWKAMRTAENSRKRRWRRKDIQKRFFKDPYKVAKEVLDGKTHKEPVVTKDALDEYIKEVASDELREVSLPELEGLPELPTPKYIFDESKLSMSKLDEVLRRKRNASRPGPNQIPYKVYKKCPQLKKYLLRLMLATVREKKIPLKWRISDGIFIPKVDDPKEEQLRTDYRQIALTNVEGKLFWSLVSNKLYKYLVVENRFIDTSCQKGSIQKMAGCWEHMSMVWNALQDARKRGKSLAVLWLDLANAYGSVPHQLIKFALRRYGIPEMWIDLIFSYYDGLWGRSVAGKVCSDWHLYEKGIFPGCTLSVILFLAAMNVILEYIGVDNVPRYKLASGTLLPLKRGFMDDLTLMSSTVAGMRVLLRRVLVVLKWARMQAKPSKSRSCTVKAGRCMDVQPYEVDGVVIKSIQQKPVRMLGRWIRSELNDRRSRVELEERFAEGMKLIDKSLITGIMKLWIYQHLSIPKLGWMLMIYEIPVSWIEKLEVSANGYIKKWLGVSKTMSTVALYCKDSPCPLPVSSLVTEYKKRKATSLVQLQQSPDKLISENVPRLRNGRKWKVEEAVATAESRVRMKKILGPVQQGRCGIGYGVKKSNMAGSPAHQVRREIGSEIQKIEDEKLYVKAVQQGLQGQWTKWKQILKRDMSWNALLRTSPRLVSFGMGVTFDTIASPANWKRWRYIEDDQCMLCGKARCGIDHVLSGCKFSLEGGRYRKRHDAVLRVLAHQVQSEINTIKTCNQSQVQKWPVFLKQGAKAPSKSKKSMSGLLGITKDWRMIVDLDKQLKFPDIIAATTLRPDMVIYSVPARIVIMVELTCPVEANFEERHQGKIAKYDELVKECKGNGWQTWFFAVEVGARGYVAASMRRCLSGLGVSRAKVKKICRQLSETALRLSFWIWIGRDKTDWFAQRDRGQSGNKIKLNELGEDMVVPAYGRGDAFGLCTSDEVGGDVCTAFGSCRFDSLDAVRDEGAGTSRDEAKVDIQVAALRKESTQRPLTLVNGDNPQQVSRWPGLKNLGNSCYINAVIQCLAVLDGGRSVKIKRDPDNLIKEYEDLVRRIREGNSRVVTPSRFKRALTKRSNQFNNSNPQDAHEFLSCMLSVLDEGREVGSGMAIEERTTGTMLSTLSCLECFYVSKKMEEFKWLSVQIGKEPYQLVMDCISEYLAEEVMPIDSGWYCTQCGAVTGKKRLSVEKSPEVLIIHLKRFDYVDGRMEKDESQIGVHEELEVARVSYKLVGVVKHNGSKESGHYLANIQTPNGWLTLNDAKVRNFNIRDLNWCSEVYLLMYRAVSHPSSVPDTSLLGGAPATLTTSQGIKGPKLNVVTF